MKFKPGRFKWKTRGLVIVCAAALSIPVLTLADNYRADSATFEIDIASDSAGKALLKLAGSTGAQIIIPREMGRSVQLPAIKGKFTLSKALDRMLDGSGLDYEFTSDESVLIKPESAENKSGVKRDSQGSSIEEIVVTANKRETRLQDTAMAISLLGADTIEKRGLVSMGDYLSTIPGVTVHDRGAGANSITMRGISASPQTERTAVGVYFGETPVSGMSSGAFTVSSDLRMVDIERVEVLKGPQGTLYGADSMGGIVRIIPKAPNLEQMEGSFGAQYSDTGELGGNNHQIQGVFNLPLIENQLALRGVAYRFENSGYVENIAGSYMGDGNLLPGFVENYGSIVRDEDNIASDETTGIRLAALWRPIEDLSINLSHARQEIDQDGKRRVQLNLPGKFQQTKVQPWPNAAWATTANGIEPERAGLREEVNVTSLALDYDLGWGTLHSASSWVDREGLDFLDYSYRSVWSVPFQDTLVNEGERFTQELRFVSRFEGALQLLAGLYYEDYENDYNLAEYYTADPANAGAANAAQGWDKWAGHEDDPYWFLGHYLDSVEQKAVFAEVSYDITDRLTTTVGVRHYEYEQSDWGERAGYWYQSETFGSPGSTTSDKADDRGETYRVNLSWKPSEETLLYAQWAEGFRLGRIIRPKSEAFGDCDIDGNGLYEVSGGGEVPIIDGLMEPDTTENYELGFKGTFADNRVSFDVALYHIDWEGLPVAVTLAKSGCGSYTANAGASTSEGIEVESSLRLMDALSLDLSASYNEAKLKGDSSLGSDGDDLPGSADINFSAGLEYGFSLAGYDAFARVDYAYVGEYDTRLGQSDAVPISGDFSQIHLKTGITMDKLAVDLFVKNLTNADDLTWVEHFSVSEGEGAAGYRLRPRTIGLNLHYSF